MKKLEKFETYELRFLPNIDNIPKSIDEITYTINGSRSNILITKYFSYFLTEDNTVDILMYGKQIKDHIQNCITGYYGTSEGYFINKNDSYGIVPTCYYANDDKSIIISKDEFLSNEELFGDDSKIKDFKKYDDVKLYERINLFDIKSPLVVTCKTDEEHGFMRIFNVGLKEVHPLWKDGDDKNIIYDLYKGHIKMDNVIEQYKNDTLKEYNAVFGDDAKRIYYKRQKESLLS